MDERSTAIQNSFIQIVDKHLTFGVLQNSLWNFTPAAVLDKQEECRSQTKRSGMDMVTVRVYRYGIETKPRGVQDCNFQGFFA